jgi:hypothetical protein
MDIGAVSTKPQGSNTPSLGSWRMPSVPGTWWGEMCRRVDADAVSPYNAGFQALAAHANPNQLRLGWTQDETHGIWDGGLYQAAWNYVRGDVRMSPLTVTTYRTPYDPATVPFLPDHTVQSWPADTGSYATFTAGSAVATGGPFLPHVHNGDHVGIVAGGSYCFYLGSSHAGDPQTVFYVKSVDSDTQLTLLPPYPTFSGSSLRVFGPFNFPPTSSLYPVADHHCVAVVRDETTGLPHYLYEAYNLRSDDGGNSWSAVSAAVYDLVAGTERPAGTGSTTASGLPYWALQLRYPDVLAAIGIDPTIALGHALRLITGSNLGVNYCVWPAKSAAGGWGSTTPPYTPDGHLPDGARIRLSASWYAANRASFSAFNQVIIDTLRYYGAINTDATSPSYVVQIDGSSDPRWTAADMNALLAIPITAFELIDTVKPQFSFVGPSSLVIGQRANFQVSYLPPTQAGYRPQVYGHYTVNGGPQQGFTNWIQFNGQPGPFTIYFTPTQSGNYVCWITITNNVVDLPPPALTYTI